MSRFLDTSRGLRGTSRWLFVAGLIARLVALPFPGSAYLNELFVPFLDGAVRSTAAGSWQWLSPWSHFEPKYFPYGTFLYAVLFVPRYVAYCLLGDDALGETPVSFFLAKAPLLCFDTFLFYLLCRLQPLGAKALLWFYWLNPVLFFITYIHGQLDVVSVSMSVAALACLARSHISASALLMSAAALAKFHVIAILPLIVAYVWNRSFRWDATWQLLKWFALFVGVTTIGFIPLSNAMLYATTGSPEASRVFALRFPLDGGRFLYVGVIAVLVLAGRIALANQITKKGLFIGAGLIFLALVLITDPMPGWHFWFLPYVALFFASVASPTVVLFWAMAILYFVHFFPEFVLGMELPSFVASITLALLQASTAGLGAVLLAELPRHLPIRGRTRPVMLGVAGDSGAGKDYFSTLMIQLFGADNTLVVAGDNYHRWERTVGKWREYTHLNPAANDLQSLVRHTSDLGHWQAVVHPQYDHGSGQFTAPVVVSPRRTIVVQGLHSLYYRDMRERFDVSVFMAPEEQLRRFWKVRRDVQERGQREDHVQAVISSRQSDSERHIQPQRDAADLVIEFYSPTPIPDGGTTNEAGLHLGARYHVWNDVPVDELVAALRDVDGVSVTVRHSDECLGRLIVDVRGALTAHQVGQIAGRLFENLRALTRAAAPPVWASGYDGVTQLFVLIFLLWSTERQRRDLH